MMIYRVLQRLDIGKRGTLEPGALTALQWLQNSDRQILLDQGAVSILAAPPIGELPGWKTRAGRLAAINIETATDFLEADPAAIAEALHAKAETVKRWQREITDFLVVRQPRKC